MTLLEKLKERYEAKKKLREEKNRPATKEDIEQLKLEVQKAKLQADLAKLKSTGKQSTMAGRLWKAFIEHEKQKAQQERSGK